MPAKPIQPWIKFQLPPSAGATEWADFLHDLDQWMRKRQSGLTIFDVQPVRDDPPASVQVERRSGFDRRFDS